MIRETALILFVVVMLFVVGLMMVYSATSVGAKTADGEAADPYLFVHRHLIAGAVGFAAIFGAARFNYRRLGDRWVYRGIVLLALVLLVLVLIPGIGIERNYARRWLGVGNVTFQPSEFAKLALILLVAVKVTENEGEIRSLQRGFVPLMLLTFLFCGLIAAEPDLGTPLTLGAVALLMVFMAGARYTHLSLAAAAATVAAAVLCLLQTYRLKRIAAFRNPWADPSDAGYHLIQSLGAFVRGGFLGQGAGAGEQKLAYLYGAHTDFVFALWAEDMGLVGTLALILLFAVFLVVGMRIALCARDRFGSVLAAGIVTLIMLQAVFHMAVTTGLVPPKGLPLPFVSYGGTALVVYLTLAGILLNIGIQAEEEERRPSLVHAG